MEVARINHLVREIEGDDIERMVDASESLQKEATLDDVPRLLELLKHNDFVVREAAAWPLSIVGATNHLPELFDAYDRGLSEGHDNDGFTTALIQLAELHPSETRRNLERLRSSTNDVYRKYALWLEEFC